MTPQIGSTGSNRGSTVGERLEVNGVVQGVGFRPFVFRLAKELGLDGFVGNDSASVFIEITGWRQDVDEFRRRLVCDAPPLAQIERVARREISPGGVRGFRIVDSRTRLGERSLLPPDMAPCSACVEELFDPRNRRYRHPFITCTNCGPRFTITRDLPYDRRNTTMAEFAMCDECEVEYRDPENRRYHAQPIACHRCGPTLALRLPDATLRGDAAVDAAIAELASGHAIAVKGLGGFNLACDATDPEAVGVLRSRKSRPDKPFAVMVEDVTAAAQLAEIGDHEAAQLVSGARPIVLLRALQHTALAANVSSGNPLVGVMLPSTPIQHLLLAGCDRPLVMTSANVRGEPIAFRDDHVTDRVVPLCDGVLTHDRRIQVSCDDSVVRIVDGELLPVRRARGYAPIPIRLDEAASSVLAVGAEIKNTFCVASTEHAWVSQHIGDMENLETLTAFESGVALFSRVFDVVPDVVAADLHPGYLSSSWARSRHGDRLIEVQHHHAHVAAVMAEHGLRPTERVVGVAFDGTGFGDDGTIWGGEILVADAMGYERVAHLAPVPLPGGESSIRNPYRTALAHLGCAGIPWDDRLAPVGELAEGEGDLLRRLLESNLACVPCSSMGRLFDAVASLLGLRQRISFEAQAAIDLEHAAEHGTHDRGHRFAVDGPLFDAGPLLAGIVDDLLAGVAVTDLAVTFHLAVVDMVTLAAERVRATHGLAIVALTGGVFQNAFLLRRCVAKLREAGFTPLTHHIVPPNDGGLSLGQAYVAAHQQTDRR